MASLFDLAKMNVSTAPGTGSTIALGTAAAIGGITFLTFAQAGATNGVIVDYSILDVNGVETGTATYNSAGPSLTGRTPTTSSNSNAAINASSASTVSVSARAATLNNAALFTAGTLNANRMGSGITAENPYQIVYGDNVWRMLGQARSVNATNLNALNTGGFYDGSNLTNSPDGTTSWFYILVQRHSSFSAGSNEYVSQTAWGLTTATNVMYNRMYQQGSGWTAWTKVTQGNASDLTSGLVAPARLGSGTPNFSTVVRGDSTWVTNGRMLLGSYTASNSATLQDTTIFTTYGPYFPNFEIVYDNIVNQTTSRPLVLEVYSGGAFQTSGYQGYTIGTSATGYSPSTWVPLTANGAAAFPLNGYSGTARCYNPTGGGVVNWTNQSTGVVAGLAHVQSGGGAWLTAAAIAGFRIRFDSGNIVSGIVRVYGIA